MKATVALAVKAIEENPKWLNVQDVSRLLRAIKTAAFNSKMIVGHDPDLEKLHKYSKAALICIERYQKRKPK